MSASETKPTTRYLEVTVTRTQSSVVYLAVPEDHPRLVKRLAEKPPAVTIGQARLFALGEIAESHLTAAVKETIGPHEEWDTDPEPDYESRSAREVTEREARQFPVYEVPGPTAAEKRAELEKAGQRGLDL